MLRTILRGHFHLWLNHQSSSFGPNLGLDWHAHFYFKPSYSYLPFDHKSDHNLFDINEWYHGLIIYPYTPWSNLLQNQGFKVTENYHFKESLGIVNPQHLLVVCKWTCTKLDLDKGKWWAKLESDQTNKKHC